MGSAETSRRQMERTIVQTDLTTKIIYLHPALLFESTTAQREIKFWITIIERIYTDVYVGQVQMVEIQTIYTRFKTIVLLQRDVFPIERL